MVEGECCTIVTQVSFHTLSPDLHTGNVFSGAVFPKNVLNQSSTPWLVLSLGIYVIVGTDSRLVEILYATWRADLPVDWLKDLATGAVPRDA